MKSISNKIRVSFDLSGQPELTFVLTSNKKQAQSDIDDLRGILEKGKLLSLEVKQYRPKRSLDANALLWKMCSEIAIIIKSTKDEVYLSMLDRYGIFTHIIAKQEAVERIKQEWRTVREIGEVTINGKTGIQLQCFFGSHTYDSKEFSVLLDGVISEAQELGINTITDKEKYEMMEVWNK